MRLVLLMVASALVAGCSQTLDSQSSTARTPLTVPAPSVTSGASPSPATTSAATSPPTIAAGAAIDEVISRVEAGTPAAPEDFGSMSRDGAITALDGGVAFSTDTVSCVSTPKYRDAMLSCLVDLTNPPPRPPDVFTVWKGNWVDFDGSSVEIGSQHGDPGPFVDGEGAALPAGSSIAFGDFRCRADAAAVLCVNYAERSAVQLSADGVDGFGCLAESQAPPGIGVRLSC